VRRVEDPDHAKNEPTIRDYGERLACPPRQRTRQASNAWVDLGVAPLDFREAEKKR
jgi:hypothetical protein